MCAAHTPDPGKRCADCEAAFGRRRGLRTFGHAVGLVAAVLCLSLGGVLMPGVSGLWIGGALCLGLVARLAHKVLDGRARAEFLEEALPPALPRATIRLLDESTSD